MSDNELKLFEFRGTTYLMNGKTMWKYDGINIKEVKFNPIVVEVAEHE